MRWARAVWVKAGIVLVTGLLTLGSFLLPPVVPEDAARSEFSAKRSMTHVEQLAQAPRFSGSPGHSRAQEYLKQQLSEWGLPVERHRLPMTLPSQPWESDRSIMVENILTRLQGQGSEGAILLVAHYDSFFQSPGAGDNGTGVAVILEVVRALTAYGPLTRDVIVLFSDAEEWGLLGAQAFIGEHLWANEVAVVVNLDGRGRAGPVLLMEVTSPALLHIFRRVVTRPWAYGLTSLFYRRMGGATDFCVFRRAGFAGYHLAFVHGADVYHTPYDCPMQLDLRMLQHMGEQCLALVHVLADASESEITNASETKMVYFTLPGGWVVAYRTRWNLLLAGLALWACIRMWVERAPSPWLHALAGASACLLTAVVAVGSVSLVLHHIVPTETVKNPTVGLVLLGMTGGKVVLIFYGLHAQWRRLLSYTALSWGFWLAMTALLLGFTCWLPYGHYLVAWPLLALSLVKRRATTVGVSYLAYAVATLSFFMLWLPVVYLGFIMLTLEQPVLILTGVLLGSWWWQLAGAPLARHSP